MSRLRDIFQLSFLQCYVQRISRTSLQWTKQFIPVCLPFFEMLHRIILVCMSWNWWQYIRTCIYLLYWSHTKPIVALVNWSTQCYKIATQKLLQTFHIYICEAVITSMYVYTHARTYTQVWLLAYSHANTYTHVCYTSGTREGQRPCVRTHSCVYIKELTVQVYIPMCLWEVLEVIRVPFRVENLYLFVHP